MTKLSSSLKFGVLVGLAIYFAYIVMSGKWAFYIDPRFQWLSVIAVLLFSILALSIIGSGFREEEHDHDHHDHSHEHDHSHPTFWPIFVVAVPLVLGLAIPATPLGANALKSRGIETDFSSLSLGRGSESSLTVIASERNILDWARAFASTTETSQFNGQEADVVGFVYRDSRFNEDQFYVTRFTLTCCVADALAVGLVVQTSESATRFADDSWVQVKGTFQEMMFDGKLIPILIATEIVPTDQPDQPYLYQ